MALLRIFCWALIFILRLRFPPGSSIALSLRSVHMNHVVLGLTGKNDTTE